MNVDLGPWGKKLAGYYYYYYYSFNVRYFRADAGQTFSP